MKAQKQAEGIKDESDTDADENDKDEDNMEDIEDDTLDYGRTQFSLVRLSCCCCPCPCKQYVLSNTIMYRETKLQ